jgi:hypothetical protein
VREHVVADDQVGGAVLADDVSRGLAAEEADHRRDAALDRGLRDVGGRLDPEHRHALLDEVLEEVAVVRRDLDDPRSRRRGRTATPPCPCSPGRASATRWSTRRSRRTP